MQIIEIALLVLVMGIIMLMYAYICASEAIKKSRSRALRNQKELEITFDDLNQTAKMDSYKDD